MPTTNIRSELKAIIKYVQDELDKENNEYQRKWPLSPKDTPIRSKNESEYLHHVVNQVGYLLTLVEPTPKDVYERIVSFIFLEMARYAIKMQLFTSVEEKPPEKTLREKARDYIILQGHTESCLRNKSQIDVSKRVCTCGYDLIRELVDDAIKLGPTTIYHAEDRYNSYMNPKQEDDNENLY